MPDTTVHTFHPDFTVGDLRAQGVRATLATVREQWLTWCGEAGQPHLWAEWMAGGPGDWIPAYAQDLWALDLGGFIDWARAHRDLFPTTSETTTMTDTAVTPGNATTYTADDITRLLEDVASFGFADLDALEPAYRAWSASERPYNSADEVLQTIRDHSAARGHTPGAEYPNHICDFLRWLREHTDLLPVAAPAIPVVPIGPDHPGWADWWDALWDASEGSYESEYNKLARALGGPEHEEEEQEYRIDVRIESFYVTVYRSARASDVDNDSDDAFSIDQSDIDDAVREYVGSENVDYTISDWEVV